jgi:hypothetical protein
MRWSPGLLGALAAMGMLAGVPLPPPLPPDGTDAPGEAGDRPARVPDRQSLRTSAPKTAACVRRSIPSLPSRLET